MDMMEMYNLAVEKAKNDENFRQNLLKDARSALKNGLGIEVSEEINTYFFQSTPEHLHFVLPPTV